MPFVSYLPLNGRLTLNKSFEYGCGLKIHVFNNRVLQTIQQKEVVILRL